MTSDRTQVTPDEARAQLDRSGARGLTVARDRRVHAIGTALIGLAWGLYLTPRELLSGATHVVASIVYLSLVFGAIVYIERVARTVPRGARIRSRVGIGASVLLGLTVVMPWLNLRAQTEPRTWAVAIAAGLVIAVPSLVAAALIAKARR